MPDTEKPALSTDTGTIGVLGSPSSNNDLTIDILGTAIKRKLIGELSYFKFEQEGLSHYAIGQITEVLMRNVLLEDPLMKSLIREKAVVDAVSGVQDTYRGELNISAVFGEDKGRYFPGMLGTVPPTGTPVSLVSDAVLDNLLGRYKNEIIYLGNVYGSAPKLPLWFKHFGRGEGGAGEAYHIGVFGKTGSGKSVLAKMLLLAYARHRDLSIFIIDPQGEFALDTKGEMKNSGFDLKMPEVFKNFGKSVIVRNVSELVLQGWPLFTEILRESIFFQKIGIKNPDEKRQGSEDITRALKGVYKTNELVSKDVFFQAFKAMGSESPNQRFQDIFKDFSYHQDKFDDLYATAWKPVCELFRDREGGLSIGQILQAAFNVPAGSPKPITVINLSGRTAKGIYWNDTIQALVIKSFLDNLKDTAELAFRKSQFLNTLVILDEAHRLAPRDDQASEAQKSVKDSLVDAVRTTRKYGLGWLFISQTLASLPREVVEQLRIMFFGFGLAFGNEFSAMKELAGGEDKHLRLYQSFRDPHSAFDATTKQYNFMSIGPVSPLSFAGTPLFFTSYNTPQAYLAANGFLAPAKPAPGK